MTITYRLSTKDDGKSLAQWLNTKEVLRYFPMINKVEVEDAVRIWLSYLSQNAAVSCERDGQLVGMAVFYLQVFEKLKHQALFAIIISPDCRGMGIGTQFLEYLMDHAKNALHLEKMHLEVYEGNPAERLYTRMGFTEYGRHEAFLKDGDEYITKILMEKEL